MCRINGRKFEIDDKAHKGKEWFKPFCVQTMNWSFRIYKAVTIYQIRWSIEVYFKETSSTRAWRKEQANDFDAQIANSSIIMVQYILLTFQKRFRD
jgi:hypothetical protein